MNNKGGLAGGTVLLRFISREASDWRAKMNDRDVTPDEALAILGACPDEQWTALFALDRPAGLRTPSET